jgi:hypothetical protein
VQRLGIWLAIIGALIGFAVVAMLIWVVVAIFGN